MYFAVSAGQSENKRKWKNPQIRGSYQKTEIWVMVIPILVGALGMVSKETRDMRDQRKTWETWDPSTVKIVRILIRVLNSRGDF